MDLTKFSPMLQDKIKRSERVILQVKQDYNPTVFLVGFSGGGDSTTLLHLLRLLNVNFTAFHCNTSIGIEETRIFCRRQCFKYGIKYIEQPPPYKDYETLVLEIGFPGAGNHKQMYAMLKERAIRKITRLYNSNFKTSKKTQTGKMISSEGNNKCIVMGARVDESARREKNAAKEIDKRGRQIWVNLIRDWDEDDKDEFLEVLNLETNPVSKVLGMSGECLCGAFAKKGELCKIKKSYPNTAATIEALEKKVFAKGFTWGWNDEPPPQKEYLEIMDKIYSGYKERYKKKQANKKFKKTGQLDFFGLCSQCEVKHKLDEQRVQINKT